MAKATNDRYTQFFTPDEFKAFNEALDPQRIGGIGVMIEPDRASGSVRITYVLPSTPAERAGLQVGDVVTAVDNLPTKGLSVDVVSGHLRGKAGTNVSVAVQRPSAPAVFTITREDVQPPTVVFKMLPNGIGYVWVMEFRPRHACRIRYGGRASDANRVLRRSSSIYATTAAAT